MLFAQGHLENRRWGIGKHYPFGFPTHIIQQQLFSKVISPLNSFSFDSFLSLNRQTHVYFSRSINHETETQTNWFLLPEKMIEVWRGAHKLLTQRGKHISITVCPMCFESKKCTWMWCLTCVISRKRNCGWSLGFVSLFLPDLHPHAASLPVHAAAKSRDSPIPADDAPAGEEDSVH